MIGNVLARILWPLLRPERPPNLVIGPSKDDPYMLRWFLVPRNDYFNVYLHNMRHDDDDGAAHDHPWWSLSLCLRGYIKEYELLSPENALEAILEQAPIEKKGEQFFRINEFRRGDFKWRSKDYAHRLVLPAGEAWTIFITGPKVREWGFHCPKGWRSWKLFLGSNRPGQSRRGCGEIE